MELRRKRVYRQKVIHKRAQTQLTLLPEQVAPSVGAPKHCKPFRIEGVDWETTPVFDTYWRFAFARQEAYARRLTNVFPYSDDPILQSYKFTNAYRVADRVSQFMLREVIYRGDQSADQVFFRTVLFKLFNKIETWSLLRQSFGEIYWSPTIIPKISQLLTEKLGRGTRIYSAAYIMPSGGGAYARKHDAHLALLLKMMDEQIFKQIHEAPNMKMAFGILRAQPMLGDFLAYQFVTDINYSNISNFGEDEFVVAGPGARDGLRKCFPDMPMNLASEAIKAVYVAQAKEFQRRNLPFRTLWGRPLQLIDCQNLFCEVDKYSRVAHPDIMGLSGRTRIKQQFRPSGELPKPFFPPKWGLPVSQA
ncbi:MAG: hypothetical protein BGO25_10235 [Acidobacteriales bacterium 59-55]|nr:MAG: hypothetical protein BGO25_10235 [Acidobacteriales bacterium 59-55]